MRNMTLRACALSGAAIASLALSEAAHAGQYILDHLGMKPSFVDYRTTYVAKWDGGLRNVKNTPACFSTGIYLPQGVTVTNVIVTYSSSGATNSFASLTRNELASTSSVSLAEATLSDNTSKRKTAALTLTGPVTAIDNSRYSYGFGICLGENGGDTFYAVRIIYTAKPPTD